MKMKKFFTILLLICLVFAQVAQASDIKVTDNGTNVGRARKLNFVGLTLSISGGVITISAAAAAITSGTITGVSLVSGTLLVGTQYVQIPYFSKLTRPASGATIGSMITMKTSGANDCGTTNTGANTTFVICVSDGTNWKAF